MEWFKIYDIKVIYVYLIVFQIWYDSNLGYSLRLVKFMVHLNTLYLLYFNVHLWFVVSLFSGSRGVYHYDCNRNSTIQKLAILLLGYLMMTDGKEGRQICS